MRIAMLEDDPDQAELLHNWITGAGHECFTFSTGESFRQALKTETFDLLLIDWNLPDTTGPDVADWVRMHVDWHIPMVFVTSRDREEDVVLALERGADDYMTKPVRKLETLARLKALERRALPEGDGSGTFILPPYQFEMKERRVLIDEQPVALRNKEFELAVLLFRNVGRLLSRSYILENVWGTRGDLNTRTVDSHISRVRSKLAIGPQSGWKLNAVYHHGYRLERLAESGA